MIRGFDGPIELSEQSDGYRSVTALAGDIMMNLAAKTPDLESARGTVLIDEIGCHLHPQWCIRIVQSLREVLPNVRFVVTTHNPLCLRGTKPGEVYRLAREESNVTAQVLDIPQGITTDQLLTGSWFGLGSTLDLATIELMNEHSRLLALPKMSALQKRDERKLEEDLRLILGSYNETSMERYARSMAAKAIREENRTLELSKTQCDSINKRIKSRIRMRRKRKK